MRLSYECWPHPERVYAELAEVKGMGQVSIVGAEMPGRSFHDRFRRPVLIMLGIASF